jgi:HAD superfamily hydrolase (TIGR01549 family)
MMEAIFFDQDNTLVNTREVSGEAYRAAIVWIASQKKVDFEKLYSAWRKVLDSLKASKRPEERQFSYSLALVVKEKDLVEEAVEIYKKVLAEKVQLKPGVAEFFEEKMAGVKYILMTEDFDDQIEIKLAKFGLKEKFDLIVGNSLVGLMKPNLKFLQIAWDKFGLDPKRCLYIGDSYEKDCQLGVENGGRALVFGKDFTDFRELAEKLKSWQ